jgi:hypothetical protein
MNQSKRWRLVTAYYAVVVAILVLWTSAGICMALDHNPQGEFCAYVEEGEPANWSSQGGPCNILWHEIGRLWLASAVVATPFLLLPLLILSLGWLRSRSRS